MSLSIKPESNERKKPKKKNSGLEAVVNRRCRSARVMEKVTLERQAKKQTRQCSHR